MPDVSAFKLHGEIGLDMREFDRGVQQADQRLNNLDKRFKTTEQGAGKLKGGIDKTKSGLDQAGNSSRKFANDLGAVDSKASGATSAVGSLTGGLSRLKSNLFSVPGGGGGGGSLFGIISEGLKILPGLGMLAGGIEKVTGAMQSGVGIGFDYRRALENGQIGFEVMLKSADKAREHLADLEKFAPDSPFDFTKLIESSALIQAFGFNVKDVTGLLRDAGDASRGDLEKFNGIIVALGQIRTKGRLSFEEMNQLVERGIPAWKYLADAISQVDNNFAKLGDEQKIARAQKMAERGQLSAGGAVEAIRRGMRADFGGLGKRVANETADGLESQFRDIASKQIGTATQGLFNGYKDVLRTGISTLSSDTVTGLAEGIGAGSDRLIGAGKQMATTLIGAVRTELDSHSPSRKFMVIGSEAAEGFAVGFEDFMVTEGAARVTASIGRMVASARATATQRRSLSGLNRLTEREPEFLPKLIAGSRQRGINPDHLLNVMAVETAGSFNPQSRNPNSTASGLIQFMAATARSLGTSIQEIRKMNATDQLDYVFKYFDQPHLRGKLGTQGGLYAAVGAGRASANDNTVLYKRGSEEYRLNAATWDRDMDGLIRQGELAAAAFEKLGAGVNFTINGGLQSFNSELVSAAAGLRVFAGLTPAQRKGGSTLTISTPTIDGGSLNIDVASKAADQLLKTTGEIWDETHLTIQNFVAMPPVINEITGALKQADEPIKGLVIGTASLKERLEEVEQSIPTLREQLTDFVATMPEQIGDIFGNAVREWDGTFKGFFSSVAQGFSDLLADMAAQLMKSAVTKIMSKLLGGVIGGGEDEDEGGGGLLSGLGKLLGFADGGRPPVGVPSIVGERGAELFIPDTAGTIIPNHQMGNYANQGDASSGGGRGGIHIENLHMSFPHVRNARDAKQTEYQTVRGLIGLINRHNDGY